MTENTELKAVKQKIAKLFALGTENQSQGEMTAALQKASTLMEEWGLSIEDIDLAGEDIVFERLYEERKQRPEISGVLQSLGDYCTVKFWNEPAYKHSNRKVHQICVIGYETDVEMFKFFWSMLKSTFVKEYNDYIATPGGQDEIRAYHGRRVRASFRNGFVYEVQNTLIELEEEKEKNQVSKTGTELVPVKNGKIEEYFEEKFGIKLVYKRNYSRTGGTYGASKAGSKAGSNVRFNAPVNGGSGTKMIGKS